MKILNNIGLEDALNECKRPTISEAEIFPLIDEIFQEVKLKGDKALKKYTHFFDRVDIDVFELEKDVIEDAVKQVPDELKKAIQQAAKNIERFHSSQKIDKTVVETSKGVKCWQENRSIEKVGIYVPGGTAPLFSTVLMLAIPARIAGCKEVVLCTPPDQNGNINPTILYAADFCGVDRIFTVGGAQAIAAMTFGTEQIPQVYKVFGPGNQYVTCAKTRAQQYGVAIDMPAGPSEVLVVADDTADALFVAADLLSQAEHGKDSQVICIADNRVLADKINKEVEEQLNELPRQEIAATSLENSRILVNKSIDFTLDFINEYAPEHLILLRKDNNDLIPQIVNAGSVFIGNYTPESAGDYASGTNHTLPTAGFAKAYSGVNLDAFTKKITFQEISEEGLNELGPVIETMAEAEQLVAHKNAVSIRLKKLKQ